MEYYIWIENQKIPVTEQVYRVYWQGRRKERYFAESDIHNKVFSYDALDTEEMNGGDIFSDPDCRTVEQQAFTAIDSCILQKALAALTPEERDLIARIYYYGQSLRQISAEKDIAFTTIQYRHKKILKKLRKEFDAA